MLSNQLPMLQLGGPNDLLSYGIPAEFAGKYIDSRLCANITHVNINIAKVMDALGLTNLANPMAAHVGYDTDDRVVALIAKGIGTKAEATLINNPVNSQKKLNK